ncbi:MAG: amylo-alpha-1,6-glucosidase [Dehalococcoidia bacterium]
MQYQENDITELRVRPEALHTYQGHTLLVSGQDGVVRGSGNEGLYQHNTRLLSCWRHWINGQEPQYVAASCVDAYSMLAYYLAPGVKQEIPGLKAEEQGLALRVSRFVGEGMHEDVDLENYTGTVLRCSLAWQVDADFADLTEATAGQRQQEARIESAWRELPDKSFELAFDYRQPRFDRGVVLHFPVSGATPRWLDGRVRYDLTLEPGERRHFCISIAPVVEGRRSQPVYGCYAFHSRETTRDRQRHRFLSGATRLQTPHAGVQATWDRSVADLADLPFYDGRWPEVLTLAAGIPAYQAHFGRDTLTTAWQAALLNPVLIEATLITTARYQGREVDDFYDEQPGRIAQQVNLGPLATLDLTPYRHYYGDYVAPAGFLIALAQHFAWTGDGETQRRHEATATRVLAWLDGAADLDGDGFVEFLTRSPKGQKNQGWKDSSMAIVYEDGRGVTGPIAGCELQAYVYVAKQQYAMALALGLHRFAEARRLLKEAAALKRRFNQAFWMPAEGYIASALDSDKRQVRSIDSNAGHCLATGIVDKPHAPAIARRLMAPDMFSGWGIRTLSSLHPAYNPLSYQLGSIWPVANSTIAFGLKRYGFHQEAAELARASFDAAGLFPHHRLPELIGGYQRDREHPHPGIYPHAQSPQAWSASSAPQLVQAMLGLWPLAPLKLLLLDPALPAWLPELTLSNLHVGKARVSLRFRRRPDGSTAWSVIEKHGSLTIVEQSSAGSEDTGLWSRTGTVLSSFVPWLH